LVKHREYGRPSPSGEIIRDLSKSMIGTVEDARLLHVMPHPGYDPLRTPAPRHAACSWKPCLQQANQPTPGTDIRSTSQPGYDIDTPLRSTPSELKNPYEVMRIKLHRFRFHAVHIFRRPIKSTPGTKGASAIPTMSAVAFAGT
jgi:hypothetical protein